LTLPNHSDVAGIFLFLDSGGGFLQSSLIFDHSLVLGTRH